MAKKKAVKKKRVRYLKAAKAKVKVHFRGKRMELIIALPPAIAKELAFRLASPRRFPNPRKK